MGLSVLLLDCRGEVLERVDDTKNFLHKAVSSDDESQSVLAKIDWYGDTYFNYLQMRQFLNEWRALEQLAQTPEERALVDSIRTFAIRCQNGRGLLRFIGD